MTAEATTWFIFKTAPQKELVANKILRRQNYLAYTPIRKEYRYRNKFARARRYKSLVTYPLMVGYIFIAMGRDQLGEFFINRKALGLLQCIKSVVGINGQPVAIEHDTVQHMARIHGGGEHIAPDHYRYMRTHREFDAGDTVNVVDGPLRDRTIVVEEITGAQARAFVELFGSVREVSIPLDCLEAAE